MNEPAYMMCVRCGCAGGGKGALIAEDVAMTLSTASASLLYLFAPVEKQEESNG